MKKYLFLSFSCLFLLMFAGCSKDDENPIVDENNPPVANAGPDLAGNTGSTVTLDGSASADEDEDPLTYAWEITTLPEGSEASLTNENAATASFIPDVAGSYTIELTVNDGEASDTDETIVTVAGEPMETVVVTDNINEETIWEDIFSNPDVPDYRVDNNINVNAKLTIQPGVVVQLDEKAVISVEADGGSLVAEGEEGNRIVFTSSNEAGEVLWGGLRIKSSSSENSINYVDFDLSGGEPNLVYAGAYRAASIGIDENGRIAINNSSFSRSGGDGIFLLRTGSLSSFENNTFSENKDFPLSLSINQVGNINATNTFNDADNSSGTENLLRIYDSELDEDQEWSELAGDAGLYFVGNAAINGNLTINEGVRMVFGEKVVFEVNPEGTLIAKGTEDNKIIMTSADVAAGKKWGGLRIESTTVQNELDHVSVTHAGGEANLIYFEGYRAANIALDKGAKVKLTNSEIAESAGNGLVLTDGAILEAFGNNNFHDNDKYALYIAANMAGMVDGETIIENNADDVVAIHQSSFTSDAAFHDDGSPQWSALNGEAKYLVLGKLTVEDDLKIEEGTYLAFAEGAYANVTTDGSFNAVGTADNPIMLTAYEQDGNHNWGGIAFRSFNNNNQLKNTEVSYGGNEKNLVYISGYYGANIGVDKDASLNIEESTVSNSQRYGIAAHPSATTTIGSGVTYSNNAGGDVLAQ